ncbi:MAG: tRNA preQ1(34) S-adenosylmethionine ribosyltransferase-isomerase QueA [Elusimicrobiota bacterium]
MLKENFHINPDTLDFDLPPELIAQEPLEKRDDARMMVLHRKSNQIEHKKFSDLPDYVSENDVFVFNNAKVNQAKLEGEKPTGGKVTAILIAPTADPQVWVSLLRPTVKEGQEFKLAGHLNAKVVGRASDGEYLVQFKEGNLFEEMQKNGRIPLPPYIKREGNKTQDAKDRIYYQTVYAKNEGSVAAPTAGLHFTEDLISKIKKKGAVCIEVLLHVGWGTFKPLAGNVQDHKMPEEIFEVSFEDYEFLKNAKREGKRIISVGTTSTRTLESLSFSENSQTLKRGTSIFIRPGYQFKWVDALITNFHVPRSTPVSLTAAFSGLRLLEKAYEEAIQKKYRFFSYGDGMIIL